MDSHNSFLDIFHFLTIADNPKEKEWEGLLSVLPAS